MVIDLRYPKLHYKYVIIVTQWLINQTQWKREKSARRWYMYSGAAERGFGMRVERIRNVPFRFPHFSRAPFTVDFRNGKEKRKEKEKEKQEN